MNNPPINNELREGILGYRSFERNWSKYNKSLVERIFSLLDADSLSKWKNSLEEENKCKKFIYEQILANQRLVDNRR